MTKHDNGRQNDLAARRASTQAQQSLLIYEAGQRALAETKELLDSVAWQLIRPVGTNRPQRDRASGGTGAQGRMTHPGSNGPHATGGSDEHV